MRPLYEDKQTHLQIGVIREFIFPEHLHTHVEMVYLFSGVLDVLIGGKTHNLSPGSLAVSFPNTIHGYGGGRDAQGLMLIFSPELSIDFLHVLMRQRPCEPCLSAEAVGADVAYAMRAIREEYKLAADELAVKAFIQVILARVIPRLVLTENTGPDEHDTVYRAVSFLSEHFCEPITLEVLARSIGANKYYLSHIISSRLHTNFRTYINALRINRAQYLLRGTDVPISQICYDCGFENIRTFNRAYRLLCGMTPGQYRGMLGC